MCFELSNMATGMSLEELIIALYDVNGLKFGDFVVRTGEHSPLYIDMRVIWSYPKITKAVAEHMWNLVNEKSLNYDLLIGLPYQGIPLATYLSTKYDIPMLLKRQKPKEYGTKQLMEGHFKSGDKALIIDDVLMTGGTFIKDIPNIREAGLKVEHCVAFFDRDQGGPERSKKMCQVESHSVITLPKALEILTKAGRITKETVDSSLKYIRANRFDTAEYLKSQ